MTTASFTVSEEDGQTISDIAARARGLDFEANGFKAQKIMAWEMDITACHANGTPLRLAELLAADDVNFAHDVFGIKRHIDRTSGKLADMFLPRYAKREGVA